jgi:hypothetical protein
MMARMSVKRLQMTLIHKCAWAKLGSWQASETASDVNDTTGWISCWLVRRDGGEDGEREAHEGRGAREKGGRWFQRHAVDVGDGEPCPHK